MSAEKNSMVSVALPKTAQIGVIFLRMEQLWGKNIIISDRITKDVQARTHKRKRINKKWLKRYGFKTVPDNTRIFVTDECVFMTEKNYEKVKVILGRSDTNV